MAVIFDMDGTLIDSERIYLEMWKEVVDVNRYPGFMDLALRMVGIPAQDGKEIFCAKYGNDFPYEQIWNDLDNLFCERYKTEPVPLKSGAKELLEHLRRKGIKLAVASSTPSPLVQNNLRNAGILEYFDEIISGEMVKRGKPHPDIFLLAAEKLGDDPADCTVIEDSPDGIRAAYAAGMKPIMIPDLIPPTEEILAKASAVFPSLSELISVL